MSVKTHYNGYWASKTEDNGIFSYERNWVLPEIFEKKKGKLLDLACGDGIVSEYFAKKLGFDVTGIDVSEIALKSASRKGIKTLRHDLEKKLPFGQSYFDYVFWGDNIEHLFDPEAVLINIKRVLKDKGGLVISCPNMSYFKYRLYYLLHGQLADTEWTGNPPWYWSHIRFFTISSLKRLLAKNNFSVIKIFCVSRNPIFGWLSKYLPNLFGMIIVIEAENRK